MTFVVKSLAINSKGKKKKNKFINVYQMGNDVYDDVQSNVLCHFQMRINVELRRKYFTLIRTNVLNTLIHAAVDGMR